MLEWFWPFWPALASATGIIHLSKTATPAMPPCLSAPAGGEEAAEQWEPAISPLLLQACWQQLEAAWAASGAASAEALRHYASSGALAGEAEGGGGDAAAAGMLGAYLQLHSVPAAPALQQTGAQVQEMLKGAGLQDAGAAATAAAAMLASVHRGLGLPAAQALAAALLH